jgi:hypothetical protein
MSKRKSQRQQAPSAWPYTPEPSPRLGPSALPLDDIKSDITMDEPARARPISMARKDGVLSPNRPSLEEVLNNTAPQPYTLAAYTAFLSQQHCLETLEFVTEARRYSEKYDEACLEMTGMPLTSDTDQGFELNQMWNRILDIYVKPGAPREINLPAEERDDLVEYPYEPRPAPPTALDPAVKRMYDLMSDSIFIPFCNSLKVPPHAQTFNALSDWSQRHDLEPSRLTYDERTGVSRRVTSKRKESPPHKSSSSFSPSRSPPSHNRPTHSSSLSNALNRSSGNNRLSTHISHASAASESALTDSSEGGASPGAMEVDAVITPPTTPPTSELGGPHMTHSHSGPTTHPVPHVNKPHRSESGAWKKTMKFFGGGSSNKKKDTS